MSKQSPYNISISDGGRFVRYEWEAHYLTDEEVVRCRDCKRFSLDNSDHDYRSGWWCHRWDTDMVKPDGFCAWGERRAEQ